MTIKRLTIEGLRGFSEKIDFSFAIPDKKTPGSGLTVFVGSNNSGKSTIIEAIHLLNSNTNIIPSSARSIKTDKKIVIEVEDESGTMTTLRSTENNGAFVQKQINGKNVSAYSINLDTFILSSKRNFASTFNNNSSQNRKNYKSNVNDSDYRVENNINHNFGSRLLNIYENRKKFEDCLEKVLNPLPKWTIESMNNSNELYLEFSFDEIKHSSNGAGDGYINIFNIVDALYDATENNIILIDEPEISLHPDLQRKLFSLLVEYSKDKQIIVSTHSPYFVDWKLFSNKSKIIRLKKEGDTIKSFELTNKTKQGILKIINDYQKPHILSLNANEIFFLNDNIILTEGQDDVICYKELFKKYSYDSKASFFGWGAGGATKMNFILDILSDLGYKKVFTILDNDQKDSLSELKTNYSNYAFFAIAANDVRNKDRDKKIKKILEKINEMDFDCEVKQQILDLINNTYQDKKGLVKSMSNFEVNEEFTGNVETLISELKKYFNDDTCAQKVFRNNENKELDVPNKEIKVIDLFSEWGHKHKFHQVLTENYSEFRFSSMGGGIVSIKEIDNNIYYVISSHGMSLSSDYMVNYFCYFTVNLDNNTVILKRIQEVKNTLPINCFKKLYKKIALRFLKMK